MITAFKSEQRGRTKIDWLDSYHSFSFGNYFDPENINFGPLRVLNDDTVLPSAGFSTHPHKDMEIVSIVTQGSMAHKDSSGGQGVIKSGEIQRMTAGKGVFHSEFNSSGTEILKFYQIWFIPNERGIEPSYDQKNFPIEKSKNELKLIVSGDKNDGVLFINQNAKLLIGNFDKGFNLPYFVENGRGIYIHIINGTVDVNGRNAGSGDALRITDESSLEIKAVEKSSFLFFDVLMNFE